MSSPPLSPEDQFKPADALWLDGWLVENNSDSAYIYVGEMTLDIREARTLHEWLSKVLP